MKLNLYIVITLLLIPIAFASNVTISTPLQVDKNYNNLTIYFENGFWSINISQFEVTNFTTNITFNRYFENKSNCGFENSTLWNEYKDQNALYISTRDANTAMSLKLMSCEELLNPLCYNKSTALNNCETLKTNINTEKDSYLSMYNNCTSFYPKKLEEAESNKWLYGFGGAGVITILYFLWKGRTKLRWGKWKKDLPGMGEPGRTTKIPIGKLPLDKL